MELKAKKFDKKMGHFRKVVPNAPCGVESAGRYGGGLWPLLVPNVPCGVERA